MDRGGPTGSPEGNFKDSNPGFGGHVGLERLRFGGPIWKEEPDLVDQMDQMDI